MKGLQEGCNILHVKHFGDPGEAVLFIILMSVCCNIFVMTIIFQLTCMSKHFNMLEWL